MAILFLLGQVLIGGVTAVCLRLLWPNHLVPVLGDRTAAGLISVGLFLLFNILLNLWRCAVLPPGYTDSETCSEGRTCGVCHFNKPERTHHCSRCRRCVVNLDHHCVWTGSCIGERNLRYFLLLILQLTLGCLYTTLVCLVPLFRCPLVCPVCVSHCPHWRLGYFMLAAATGGLFCILSRYTFSYAGLLADDMTSMEFWGFGTAAAGDDHEQGVRRPSQARQPRCARDAFRDVFGGCAAGGSGRCATLMPSWPRCWLLLLWLHLACRGLDLGHARKA